MIALSLFLVLLQSAEDVPRSPLVEEGHVHEWKQTELSDRSIIWIDGAELADIRLQSVSYPVVLIRGIQIRGDGPIPFSDMKFAVDCAGSRLAPLDAWFQNEDPAVGRRESPSTIRFHLLNGFPEPLAEVIFDHACHSDEKKPSRS